MANKEEISEKEITAFLDGSEKIALIVQAIEDKFEISQYLAVMTVKTILSSIYEQIADDDSETIETIQQIMDSLRSE